MDYETRRPVLPRPMVAVVFDVLRATSTMAAAFHSGVKEIRICGSPEEGRQIKVGDQEVCLAGERGGLPPEGFDRGNSPREHLSGGVSRLILTTTNGTRAWKACAGVEVIVAGSLNNRMAVAQYIQSNWPEHDLWMVCAGTGEEFALEDGVGAGALLEAMGRGSHPLGALYRSVAGNLREALASGKNGRRLLSLGLAEDVDWCARLDSIDVVPVDVGEGVIFLANQA